MLLASNAIWFCFFFNLIVIKTCFRVFKAINCETGLKVAMKRIKIDENEKRRKEIKKEILIHQNLKHQNIIKFIEVFGSSGYICFVQELAEGGELFEKIEPDVGFPEQVAHFYFVQLIRSIVI